MYMASFGQNKDIPTYLKKITSPRSASDTLFFSCTSGYCGNAPGKEADGRFWQWVSGVNINMPMFFHFGKDPINLNDHPTDDGRSYVLENGRTNVLYFDGNVADRKVSEWVMRSSAITAPMAEAGVDSLQWNTFWRGGR